MPEKKTKGTDYSNLDWKPYCSIRNYLTWSEGGELLCCPMYAEGHKPDYNKEGGVVEEPGECFKDLNQKDRKHFIEQFCTNWEDSGKSTVPASEQIIRFGDLLGYNRRLKKAGFDTATRITLSLGFVNCATIANEKYHQEAIDLRIAQQECHHLGLD